MGLQLLILQAKFLFLGASISNLLYLFSFSLSLNLITFALCIIIRSYLSVRNEKS